MVKFYEGAVQCIESAGIDTSSLSWFSLGIFSFESINN